MRSVADGPGNSKVTSDAVKGNSLSQYRWEFGWEARLYTVFSLSCTAPADFLIFDDKRGFGRKGCFCVRLVYVAVYMQLQSALPNCPSPCPNLTTPLVAIRLCLSQRHPNQQPSSEGQAFCPPGRILANK